MGCTMILFGMREVISGIRCGIWGWRLLVSKITERAIQLANDIGLPLFCKSKASSLDEHDSAAPGGRGVARVVGAELDTIKRMNSIPMKKVSQRSVAMMLKAGKPLAGLLVGLSSTLAGGRSLGNAAVGRSAMIVYPPHTR